tara:strand:+ start:470 stop:814 length:345 start_codon:yes stop_codon:yes gene_type:complete
MANTYTWIFDPIEVGQTDDHSDVVKQIHWRMNAVSDDSFTSSIYGSVVCGEPDDDSFIEFDSDDFTEDLVKSWVISRVGEDATEEKLQQVLDEQIASQQNPPTISKRPPGWSVA